jgi:hypothetical protein
MSYTERVRHPSGALDPPQEKSGGFWPWLLNGGWRWLFGGAVVALILVGWLRPAWLGKLGVHVAQSGEALGGVVNPFGWR